ncbi:MAG: SpoIIE family protein phosphatase [Chitinivibrionales bacterium]|nr:SpoIIE family protein phosphatase [Chitinivibrionales bacterium]
MDATKIDNYAPLLDRISSPACFIDPHLLILSSNKAFNQLVGLNGSCSGENCYPSLIPYCGESYSRWLSLLEGKGTSVDGNISIQNSDGNTIPLSVITVPFIEKKCGLAAFLIICNSSESTEFMSQILRPSGGRQPSYALPNRDMPSQDQLIHLVDMQRQQLQEMNRTLQKVKREINNELEMAKSVQVSLMPKELPEFLNIKIASIYIPANMVGGDFYDIILTPSQKLAVLIFDVSGHGVPAALIGAMAKMLFAHYIELLDSPAQIFTEVNTKLCNYIRTEHYLTAFLGILDPIQNTMLYSRAGHVKPIVFHATTEQISYLDSNGFFIGHSALSDIAEYYEETVSFQPHDKIIFYTDGLTEGFNDTNELYGNKRLAEIISRNGMAPIKRLLQIIRKDQKQFRNKTVLRDDFTMLCIQIGDSNYLLAESGFTKEDAPQILVINKIAEIEKACGQILRRLDNTGFSDKEIKRIKICLYEMIINALVHGNDNSTAKTVLIAHKISRDRIAVSVVDEGSGFDYENIPNPTDPDNIMKENGRGIFIIRRYMDEVHFNARGNRILVIKNHCEEDI